MSFGVVPLLMLGALGGGYAAGAGLARRLYGKRLAELEEDLRVERACAVLQGSGNVRRHCATCKHCDGDTFQNKSPGLLVAVCRLRPRSDGGYKNCADMNPNHDCPDWTQ